MAKTNLKTANLQAPWLNFPIVQATFAALNRDGFEARAVGGAIRNTLLGVPISDIDFATTAPPDDIIRLAEAAGLKCVPTGIEHGTVTLVLEHAAHGPHSVEVTTLRLDVETDGRRARVAFTDDWAADAARRDFTINALYADSDGGVSDPVGGLADIATRSVRFIGDADARIKEDYLRILRFFRFSAQYTDANTSLDAEALSACARGADGLSGLSGERIRTEMLKLLAAPFALRSLAAMRDYAILPRVTGVTSLGAFEALTAAEQALSRVPDALLRLSALAVRISEDAERIAETWRLSRAERTRLTKMAAVTPPIFQDMREHAAKAALYRLGTETFRDRILLAWARGERGYQPGRWIWLYELPDRWPQPVFPVQGADIAELGVPEGPDIGDILRHLESYWIEREFEPGRRTLLRAAKQFVRQHAPAAP